MMGLKFTDPKNAVLAAECMLLFRKPSVNLETLHPGNMLHVTSQTASVVCHHLAGKRTNVKAPSAAYPQLRFLSEKDDIVCKMHNMYETLAVIISRGNYVPGSYPRLLEAWLRYKRGDKIRFPAYFSTVLYGLGLPPDTIVDIVDEKTIVLTKEGLEWISVRSTKAFCNTYSVERNTAILKLGKMTVVPWKIITPAVKTDKTFLMNPVTPFIEHYIAKAYSGGEWLTQDMTRNLAKDCQNVMQPIAFYKRLYVCMWGKQKYIFNDTEINVNSGHVIDDRHRHEKLLDYAWKDSHSIALPNASTEGKEFVNYPLVTCVIHTLPEVILEDAALHHLDWKMKNLNICTEEQCRPL